MFYGSTFYVLLFTCIYRRPPSMTVMIGVGDPLFKINVGICLFFSTCKFLSICFKVRICKISDKSDK